MIIQGRGGYWESRKGFCEFCIKTLNFVDFCTILKQVRAINNKDYEDVLR